MATTMYCWPPNVRALLEKFLAARIAGRGAEGFVGASSPGIDVPLLYATTSGASYERYEIERFGGEYWAYGGMHFAIRLFADGGKTVVEQLATFNNHGAGDMWLEVDEHSTTENGATLVPVPVKHFFFDGQVSMAAPYPWSYDGDFAHYYGLSRQDRSVELIEPMFNPLPVAEGCATGAEPANAQALAQAIGANRDLLTSTPVAVTLNGHAALTIDITLAPGASSCEQGTYVLTRELCCGQRGVTIAQGSRMRLYLVDAPAGSSLGVIAIAIVAPEWRFESVLEAAVPIVETLEFHAPLGQ